MALPLTHKTVLITGASSGIGRAAAEAFAKEGAKLILLARRIDRLEVLADELKAKYSTQSFIATLDVRDPEGITQVLHELPKMFRDIDILLNNAGLAAGLDKIQDANVDDWEAMIDTNVKGLLYVTRAILPLMLARNSGHIINISSISGHIVYSGGVVYCATKHAVRAISRGIKLDCKGTPIRVTDIGPGAAETEFSMVRFKGDGDRAKKVYEGYQAMEAHDIADAIIFAATRPLHVDIAEIVINATEQAAQLA